MCIRDRDIRLFTSQPLFFFMLFMSLSFSFYPLLCLPIPMVIYLLVALLSVLPDYMYMYNAYLLHFPMLYLLHFSSSPVNLLLMQLIHLSLLSMSHPLSLLLDIRLFTSQPLFFFMLFMSLSFSFYPLLCLPIPMVIYLLVVLLLI